MSRPAAVGRRRKSAFDTGRELRATFVCIHCGTTVTLFADGTGHRNHCPRCLWSRHVDVHPGDRAHLCRAPMEPVALWVLRDGEQRVIHRCTRCGTFKANRAAGDDSTDALVALARGLDTGPPDRAC